MDSRLIGMECVKQEMYMTMTIPIPFPHACARPNDMWNMETEPKWKWNDVANIMMYFQIPNPMSNGK